MSNEQITSLPPTQKSEQARHERVTQLRERVIQLRKAKTLRTGTMTIGLEDVTQDKIEGMIKGFGKDLDHMIVLLDEGLDSAVFEMPFLELASMGGYWTEINRWPDSRKVST